MTGSAPAKPPPSFLSLPTEIHTLIASHLDKTSVIELSRVARSFHHLITTDLLWRRLNLYLPDDYGEQPLVQPYERSKQGRYQAWARAEARAAEERHQDAVREKIRTILKTGGEEQWRAVREVWICPSAICGLSIAQVLDLASPVLTKMTLLPQRQNEHQSNWKPFVHQTLDFRLLGAGITLPSLTYLDIGPQSVASSSLILQLVQMSPNLKTLLVDHHRLAVHDGDGDVAFPASADLTTTNLHVIRYTLDAWGDTDDQWGGTEVLVSIVQNSPHLRQAHIVRTLLPTDEYPLDPAIADMIVADLAQCPRLSDLRWPAGGLAFQKCLEAAGSSLDTVCRLVLHAYSWVDYITNLPTMPNLEEIYFDAFRLKEISVATLVEPIGLPGVNIIGSDLARQLRINRKLRSIHNITTDHDDGSVSYFKRLPGIRKRNQGAGRVYSVRCGDAELLHLRLFRAIIEIADLPWPIAGGVFSPAMSTQVQYRAEDGSERVKVFISQAAPFWQDFTEYEGLAVPLSVLEDMRKVAGADKASWNKRGVEVGEEVWKVLTDWHAGVLAA